MVFIEYRDLDRKQLNDLFHVWGMGIETQSPLERKC